MKRPVILNVDDNDINRYLRAQYLVDGGFYLLEARTSAEALEIAFENRPDLVLLDINLPDGDGIEVCRVIKTDPRTKGTMVLQISASAVGITDAVKGLEGGADGYLIEPIEPALLLAHVRSLIRLRDSELARHRSEARLELALESAQMGSWELDVATNEVRVGGSHHELFGVSPEHFDGTYQSILNSVHPDDKAAFDQRVREALTHKSDYRAEFRVIRPNQEIRWMRAVGQVIRDDSGKPVRMIGVVLDNTDHRRAEDELRASQERLALALETNQLCTWDWDLREDKIIWSGHHCELLGIKKEDFDGTYDDFLRRIHPDDRKLVVAEMARVIEGKEEHYLQEYRTVWSDGSVHWLEGRARFFYDGEGRAVRQLGIVQDITVHKDAERALRESEERLALSHSAAGIGMWDWNLKSGSRVVNTEYHALHGLPPDSKTPSYEEWLATIHPDDRERTNQTFQRFFEGDPHYEDEFRVVWPNGIIRWLESKGRAQRDADGKVERLIGVLYDVTGRKQAEIALERANADIQQFAFAAGHDLQAPIRTARIYVDLLRRQLGENLDPGAAAPLETVETSLTRMQALVTNLLRYAQASQSTEERPNPTSLDAALVNALSGLQGALKESGAEVIACPLPVVPAWSDQITQVFQNLISNAIKYRRPEERPKIEIRSAQDDGFWLISVSDNGQGFKPEYAERIFNVFERLHGPNVSGTGLGLAICRRIIQRHGGTIWAESEPNRGATFRFSLPA